MDSKQFRTITFKSEEAHYRIWKGEVLVFAMQRAFKKALADEGDLVKEKDLDDSKPQPTTCEDTRPINRLVHSWFPAAKRQATAS